MRIDRKSLTKFISGSIQISLRGIERAKCRVRLRGTRIGQRGCPQFPLCFVHAALSHGENSKVVVRAVVPGSDRRKMCELPARPDVIFFQKPDGSE